VSACHHLNGLDEAEAESGRSVGLLQPGGADSADGDHRLSSLFGPRVHEGLPGQRLRKIRRNRHRSPPRRPVYRCQYCTLTCPYEVPQYSKSRGTVRKCDMCSDRRADGEAPACMQACPNEAISIRIVDVARLLEEAQTDTFLPGAPSPRHHGARTERRDRARVFPAGCPRISTPSLRPIRKCSSLDVVAPSRSSSRRRIRRLKPTARAVRRNTKQFEANRRSCSAECEAARSQLTELLGGMRSFSKPIDGVARRHTKRFEANRRSCSPAYEVFRSQSTELLGGIRSFSKLTDGAVRRHTKFFEVNRRSCAAAYKAVRRQFPAGGEGFGARHFGSLRRRGAGARFASSRGSRSKIGQWRSG